MSRITISTMLFLRQLGAAFACAVALSGGQVRAENAGILTLDEAMTGATAMTELLGAYLFIARPDGGYVCAINLNDRFFPGILQDPSGATAFANRPGAVCVTARLFEDLTDASVEKL